MLLTLPIREVLPATPRASVLRIDLEGERFPYQPGQAVRVATHGHETRRPYSLASAPDDAVRDDCLELLVGLDAQGAAGPHLALEPRALLDVEGPLGKFTFPDDPLEQRFVFIAGGTGIAPLRAMMRRALQIQGRRIGLLYSARTLGDFAYQEELRALAADGRIELRMAVTREVVTDWSGARGRISVAELSPLVHDPATLCFICGPPPLVHDVPKMLGELGVPASRIRIEEWG